MSGWGDIFRPLFEEETIKSFLAPATYDAYRAWQGYRNDGSIFDAIDRGIDPGGTVDRGTRAFGEQLPQWARNIAPVVGGLGGWIWGPGGAAAGAGVGTKIKGQDNQTGMRNAGIAATLAYAANYAAASGKGGAGAAEFGTESAAPWNAGTGAGAGAGASGAGGANSSGSQQNQWQRYNQGSGQDTQNQQQEQRKQRRDELLPIVYHSPEMIDDNLAQLQAIHEIMQQNAYTNMLGANDYAAIEQLSNNSFTALKGLSGNVGNPVENRIIDFLEQGKLNRKIGKELLRDMTRRRGAWG